MRSNRLAAKKSPGRSLTHSFVNCEPRLDDNYIFREIVVPLA
jgi:hypothetical protein